MCRQITELATETYRITWRNPGSDSVVDIVFPAFSDCLPVGAATLAGILERTVKLERLHLFPKAHSSQSGLYVAHA